MTTSTPPPDPASPAPAGDVYAARASALDALQAWARRRDELPHLRAELLALAWHTGNRNIRELARLADVSRDTIYADLRSRGIDHADRTADATPRHQPLGAAATRGLADLVQTQVLPSMLAERPAPEARIAWLIGLMLERTGVLLTTSPEGPAPGGSARAELWQGITDRAGSIIEIARRELADEYTDTQLAAVTTEDQLSTLDGANEPVVDQAVLRLSVPNGNIPGPITVELGYRDGRLIEVASDSPLVEGELDRAAHLAIHQAFDTIARALRPALAERAYLDDTDDTDPAGL